jgi:hypothetical protein
VKLVSAVHATSANIARIGVTNQAFVLPCIIK